MPQPHAPATPRSLDAIDRKILAELRANARLTMNDLAERVGLSSSPCWSRVKRLEESGAIRGYVAVLDAAVLGLEIIVFIEVTLDKHDDKALDRFGDALSAMPEVLESYLVTGDYDYLVKLAVASTHHYEQFLREKLYRIQGIRHTRSTFALRELKRLLSVDPLTLP
ncbi:AsnC family transcriptional regulator [Rhodospirillum rubrum]|uniref:Lrp/AsnC family transcriptional regulator n=1 Tax=Rhodospirillum rubrum TaxID=1085 RepID=UPI0019045EC9|nr:Lrp/AsnC family transcriptional regulator [Rhodospirillum rubrum]MBK1663838.1 AsnC family transcriptional regulator [Rhodospirillum rubrum]MBK1677918.1 AsnC family transcriptional regulator [Rhodospirillum rubrum]